jgi:hypothetical protein
VKENRAYVCTGGRESAWLPRKLPSGSAARKAIRGSLRYRCWSKRRAYLEVKRRLIGRDIDASDLVNSPLLEWLKKDG